MRAIRVLILGSLTLIWVASFVTLSIEMDAPLEWLCMAALGATTISVIGYWIYRSKRQQILHKKYRLVNSILSTAASHSEIAVFDDRGKTIWTTHPNAYPNLPEFLRKLVFRTTPSKEFDFFQHLINKRVAGDVLLSNSGATGTPHWWSARVRTVDLSFGLRRKHLIIFLTEITRHLNDASKAHQSYNSLNKFVETLPFGLCHTDQDHNITSVNETFSTWVAQDKSQVQGRKLTDFLKSIPAEAFCKTTVTVPGAAVFDSIVHKTSSEDDQTVYLFYRLDKATASLLSSSKGQGDLSQSKAAIPGIIITVDGRILSCNHSFFAMLKQNHSPEDERNIAKNGFTTLLHPSAKSEVMTKLRRCYETKAPPTPFEIHFKANDLFTTAYISRVPSEEGDTAPHNLMLQFIDISEQKRLERQFIQSQKMQAVGQLAGGIAHDFNNLLTAMIGFCDLLLQRYTPSDPSYSDVMQIKQNANRATNLVRQLLAFSRQQTLQPKVVNITDSLAELSALLQRLIGAGIELKMSHGREIWNVKVDVSQLEQVIINLVVNARDAMDNEGTLTIRTSNFETLQQQRIGHDLMAKGNYALIEVEDTGTGIAPEHIEHIFEPFFSTKEVGSGTGLGLSTVYGIVKQTDGYVQVESQTGQGTTFKIYLPRHIGPDTTEAKVANHFTGDLTGQGSILLVEDEDAVRLFGARALREKGYQVIEAANGEVALDILDKGTNVDLLVTDVVMPKVDGPTLCKKMKEKTPELKTIFISGYTEDTFRSSLDQDEKIHFLQKPFTLKELASKVKEVIKND